MTLDDILPTADKRYHNNPLDVDLVERFLGARFPAGYRELIARFGGGVLADFLKIFPPRHILHGVLVKWRGVETILIADTPCGAELIFHLSTPDRIYALSGDDDRTIYFAGDGFLPALDWVLSSGVLVEPGRALGFQPWDFKPWSIKQRRQG